jgi:hypothetical protein
LLLTPKKKKKNKNKKETKNHVIAEKVDALKNIVLAGLKDLNAPKCVNVPNAII